MLAKKNENIFVGSNDFTGFMGKKRTLHAGGVVRLPDPVSGRKRGIRAEWQRRGGAGCRQGGVQKRKGQEEQRPRRCSSCPSLCSVSNHPEEILRQGCPDGDLGFQPIASAWLTSPYR